VLERWSEIPIDATVPLADSVRTGQPIYILSVAERDRLYPTLANDDGSNRAFLTVPLALDGRVLGALALSFAEPRTQRHRSLLEIDEAFILAVGQQAAVSFERARLYEAERRARRDAEAATARAEKVRDQLSFLWEVSAILSKSLEHRESLAELGVLAAGRIADWCAIDLVDERGEIERIVARHADPVAITRAEEAPADWPIDPGLPVGSPAVIRSGRPELYPDITSDEADRITQDETELAILRSIGVTSAMIVPLTARGRIHGAMTLVSTSEVHRYDPDDLDFAMLVALRAGVATDNARLFAEARRKEEEAAFVAEISALLAGARDERGLFDELGARLVPFMADWCIVDLVQADGTYDRVSVAPRDPAMTDLASRIMQRGHYAIDPTADRGVPKVLRTGATDYAFEIPPSVIDDVAAGDPEYRDVLQTVGCRSYIAVPLTVRGRVLGAITLVTADSGRVYAADDVVLAEDVARRASIALENVRLLAERSAAARSLQESLLPPVLPTIPGVALAARYRAAGEGNEVGGDFYDVFPAASGGWAVVVGDVCGKGPAAAALTALVRYTIRTLSMQIRKPRRILARLNDAILSQRSDGRFCTLAYARLDVDDGGAVSLRLASGGHPLPMLVRRSGEVRAVGKPGALLGVFAEAVSAETSIRLEPGDAVVFYTDGVTEARVGSEVFGDARLADVLAACVGADAAAIARQVDHAARDFQAGEQRDDVAVLVVQSVPAS
jgi:serine phosphatase RsbU (regulator of sigma subunit)